MKLPNWLKTRTRIATDKTVDDLANVRVRLAESIRDLENAVSQAARKSEQQDAD
ncbi:hypothetical protein LCGC14_0670000 [marine sediment metagenome]|uniref:Uncharacterized protein n=1 Tax=marine sediment metagenome TaxID=412755 RepID=A0A0F9TCL2_9ZZZZ